MIFWSPIKLCSLCCINDDKDENKERYTLFIYENRISVNVREDNDKTNILVSQKVSRTVVTIEE